MAMPFPYKTKVLMLQAQRAMAIDHPTAMRQVNPCCHCQRRPDPVAPGLAGATLPAPSAALTPGLTHALITPVWSAV